MEPVVRLPDSDRTIPWDIEKKLWFVTVKEQCFAVSTVDNGSALAVLPFLEIPVREIEEAVSLVLSRDPTIKFPFELRIKAGFMHGSPHWTDCSLTWLAKLDTLETSFNDDLERVVAKTKRYSQKSRQLARRLIKQGR